MDKNKLLTIINSISDGVFTIDTEFRITFMNEAVETITGYKKDEVIGKYCHNVFKTNICKDSCALRQTLSTGEPVINRLVCMINKAGKKVPISVSTALLKNEDEKVIGAVETFRDLDMGARLHSEYEAKYTFENMISRNAKMREIFKVLPMVAQSDSTVLLQGESGTGKELVARALHNLSARRKGPFVSLNCGALPDQLLESELFGYKAGAFTDAKKDKKGRFALAEGGTFFLDEIGDISPALQVKLLRVLQEKTYEPLGATQSFKADVRIITATNKNLEELTAQEKFRKDLFYRINVVKLTLPPLRERRDDIPLLVEHFVSKFNRLLNKNIAGVSSEAMRLLLKHNYPGNIRELENIIEHAFIMTPKGVIRPEFLPEYMQDKKTIPAIEIAGTMKELEALFLIAALKRNNWKRNKTAKELGINPSTLYRKIKRLGLKIPKE